MSNPKQQPTGWWNPRPYSSRSKFHYITSSGRSLCGKWAYLRGDIEEGRDDHPDNCAECRKRKAKESPKGKKGKK